MTKGVLRFFFGYGAGGCLWAGNDETRIKLGDGPVDAADYAPTGQVSRKPKLILSVSIHQLRDQIDFQHSGYLNPLYPPDPSLWTQGLCDRFNASVEALLALLHQELGEDYDIIDQQRRYVEDPELSEYLAENPSLSRIDEVTISTVG